MKEESTCLFISTTPLHHDDQEAGFEFLQDWTLPACLPAYADSSHNFPFPLHPTGIISQ